MIHTGDPASFWDPIDFANEQWLELSLFGDRRYSDSWFPRFEELMAERDRLFKQNRPQTTTSITCRRCSKNRSSPSAACRAMADGSRHLPCLPGMRGRHGRSCRWMEDLLFPVAPTRGIGPPARIRWPFRALRCPQAGVISFRSGRDSSYRWNGGKELVPSRKELPGARWIDADMVVPGPSPDIYAFYRTTTQRNLYRIPIR